MARGGTNKKIAFARNCGFPQSVAGAPNMAGYSNLGNVRIVWDVDMQAYKVYAPYNASFVQAIKRLIPHSDRNAEYDSQGKFSHWVVTERFMEPIKLTAEMAFGTKATVIDKEQAEMEAAKREAARKRLEEEAKRQMGITTLTPIQKTIADFAEMLPHESFRKAYIHAMATKYHPDRGGDAALASDFNSKWQEIEKVFYQKKQEV